MCQGSKILITWPQYHKAAILTLDSVIVILDNNYFGQPKIYSTTGRKEEKAVVLQMTETQSRLIKTIRESIGWWMETLEADSLQGWFTSVVYNTFRAVVLFVHKFFHLSSSASQKILLETPRATCIFVNILRADCKGEGSYSSTHEQRNWVSFWMQQIKVSCLHRISHDGQDNAIYLTCLSLGYQ